MIGIGTGSETPVNIIALRRHIDWLIPFVGITKATAAARFATTIIIGNHVVAPVYGVGTSTDPTHRGNLGTRWARIDGSTTASAQITVNRAMSPIVASQWIALLCCLRTRSMTAAYR